MKRIAFIFFTLFFISQHFFAQELETSVVEPDGETITNPQEQDSSEEQPDSEE